MASASGEDRRGPPLRVEARLQRGGPLVALLWIPALVFAALAGLRALAYDRGLARARRAAVPVVSLGNLTAGGTGKSPLVAWVVRFLQSRGARPGVLSRGYRSGAGGGDETRMLAAHLGGAPQAEDPDRVRGAKTLCERGADVVVLDDGFQHRRLARDLDVVLLDATRPFGFSPTGEGRFPSAPLPRGLLRESPRALRRADLVVFTRVDQVDPNVLSALEALVRSLAPGVPTVRARHAPVGVRRNGGEPVDPGVLRDVAVDLVSGIGNPDGFERTVRALGARVGEHRRFQDHHDFSPSDLAGLGAAGRVVLTTEKDWVKLGDRIENLWVLCVEMELLEGREVFEALLESRLLAGSGKRAPRRLLSTRRARGGAAR